MQNWFAFPIETFFNPYLLIETLFTYVHLISWFELEPGIAATNTGYSNCGSFTYVVVIMLNSK